MTLSRRAFLGTVAASFSLALIDGRVRRARAASPPASAFAPNVFITIHADGRVDIVCHRTEIGQGIRSSIPMLIADELGADLERVTIVQAVGDKKYGDQNTDGSRSIRTDYERLRRFGATARTMLVSAAAARWKVPANECVAADHRVTHTPSQRAFGFGELVADAGKLKVPAEKSVTLRPVSELKHVGRDASPRPIADGADIVRGRGIYGADVRLDGMLTAVIVRPPTVLGKVARFDDAEALKVPGVVKVVELPALTPPVAFKPLGGVAVLATNTWAAMKGAKALSIVWELGPNADYDSDVYRQQLLAAVNVPGKVVRTLGDVDAALSGATSKVVAEYYVPHLAHAAMEPPAAVVSVSDGAVEAWASTQNPQAARQLIAQVLGVDQKIVTVNVTLTGGAFGRKSKPDFVAEAALLSRAAKAPVRVQWTRADDLQHGYFHAVSAQRYEAGLDGNGKVVAWLQRTAFPPIPSTFNAALDEPSEGELGLGALDTPLDVPNLRLEAGKAKAHVRIGWLRSVCNIFHAFGLASFVDELAAQRRIDPKAMWLELLGPPRPVTAKTLGVTVKLENYGMKLEEHPIDVARFRAVIERVTELAKWDVRPDPKSGMAYGLAAHRSFNSAVACVVALKENVGIPIIDEAWIVIDAGQVVNAERVRSQMEGAVYFGMSIALHGNITAKGGVIQQASYRDYPVVRMPESPRAIHVDIMPSSANPGGVGEPGVPPVAPAIANAWFALTGRRVRSLPLR